MNQTTRDPLPIREGAGKRNLDLFLAGSKSSPICFYFEDEGSEELYIRFLKRIFPKYAKPFVVCTGGKTKKHVLADARAHQISPVIFIQDKDFDDLIGTLPTDDRIVMLNRYSFENYLVNADAFIELAIESKRRLRKQDATDLLEFSVYFDELYSGYQGLASLFVIARRLNLKGIKTTKPPISDFVDDDSAYVTTKNVADFRELVANAALKEQRISEREEIETLLVSALDAKAVYKHWADADPNSHFCGKHLIDLALVYIDSKIGSELSRAERFEIAMRLLLHTPVEVFGRIKFAILESLKKQGATADVLALVS